MAPKKPVKKPSQKVNRTRPTHKPPTAAMPVTQAQGRAPQVAPPQKDVQRWYKRWFKKPSPEAMAERAKQVEQAERDIGLMKERLALKALSQGGSITALIGVFYREEYHVIGSKTVRLTDTLFEWRGRTYNIDAGAVTFFWKRPFMLYERELANPLVFRKGEMTGQLSITLQRYFKDHIIRETAKNQPTTKVGWDKWTVALLLGLGMFAAFLAGGVLLPHYFGTGQSASSGGVGGVAAGGLIRWLSRKDPHDQRRS